MTTVFLDIDGVLNCFSTKEEAPSGVIGIEPGKVALLRQILDLAGDSTVVLTTSWRDEWEPDTGGTTPDGRYLAESLAREGIAPSGKVIYDGRSRGAGIRTYIEAHAEIDRILILDNEPFDYRAAGVMPFWLQNSLTKGLQEKHIRQAARILAKQTGREYLLARISR